MKMIARFKLCTSLAVLLALALAMLAPASPPTRAANDCVGPLHHKSAAGLMPAACGLDPSAPALAAVDAPPVTFLGPPINTRVGSWAQVLAAADFNSDQADEAAVATAEYFDTANDQRVHLFKQFGATFERLQQVPTGKYAEAAVALDANHDGLTDLVVAGEDGVLLVTQAPDGPSPLNEPIQILTSVAIDALAVADINGDLKPDLLAVAPLSNTILAWTSSPTGLDAYELNLDYPTDGYSALAVGDFNNDGYDDLAVLRGSGYATDSVVIFLQDSGTFPVSYKLSPEIGGYLPHSLAVGDVNGNGLDDLIVTAGGNTPDAYLNVFLQQVTDATTTPPTSSLSMTPVTYAAHHLPGAVQVADINHDGREDVVLANDAWRTISVYPQTSAGTLSPYAVAEIPYSSRYRPNALALGDFDGNGSLDVAIVGRTPGLTVLSNTGTAPTASISQPPDASVINPGTLEVEGTTTAGTTAVEVRIKGLTDWLPATLNGTNWQISIDDVPDVARSWWIEARAIAGTRYQAPPARHRVQVSGVSGRVHEGILALYTFDEGRGAIVQDVSGFGEPLNLVIEDPAAVQWEQGHLVVTNPTLIASPGAATKIYTELHETNEFTVEAWVVPATTAQEGPARIVTFSHTSYDVNFSLAQGLWGNRPSAMYTMHLNTTRPGYNNESHFLTPQGSLTTALNHVLFTRHVDGTARFYLNGVQVAQETLGGDFSNWDPQYPLALANEVKVPRPWLGAYHLVAVYRRALTAEEVAQNFRAGTEDTLPLPSGSAPVVADFTINNRASSTDSRDVILIINASGTSDDRVHSVLVKEYIVQQETKHWVEVQRSPWLNYATDPSAYAWRLTTEAGVRYLQVWARDANGVISRFPYQAFINYVPARDTLAEGRGRVYRYPLNAGEQLTARVQPFSGDPDLYIWAPSDLAQEPWISNRREVPDEITLVAPIGGVYQIEVYGYTAAEYQLTVDISPAADMISLQTGTVDSDKEPYTAPLIPLDSKPAFTQPTDMQRLFLPIVIR